MIGNPVSSNSINYSTLNSECKWGGSMYLSYEEINKHAPLITMIKSGKVCFLLILHHIFAIATRVFPLCKSTYYKLETMENEENNIHIS